MKRARSRTTAIIALLATAALSCASAAAIPAADHPITVRVGDLVFHGEDAFLPRALPKNRMTPISFHGSASLATTDGSHIPPAETVHLQVDRHFRFDSAGLPSCVPGRIEATAPSQAMKACGPALFAKGSASAQVEFPESVPFTARGPVLGFNGPSSGGYPEMLYYAYVDVPAPTAIVVVAKLSKDSGRYGYRISISVPKIAGGSGSLTGFHLTINRRWSYNGRQHSYLNADCPDGHFVNQFEADFAGGTDLSGILVSDCQPKA